MFGSPSAISTAQALTLRLRSAGPFRHVEVPAFTAFPHERHSFRFCRRRIRPFDQPSKSGNVNRPIGPETGQFVASQVDEINESDTHQVTARDTRKLDLQGEKEGSNNQGSGAVLHRLSIFAVPAPKRCTDAGGQQIAEMLI